MDTTDKNLLQLLQTDSKRTTKEVALKLNLSVTAVYERIKKLEREGIINKYVAVVDKSKVGKSFVVFCPIKLLQQTKTSILGFEKEIIHFNEVLECFNISGDFDYMLKIVLPDMESYHHFHQMKLSALPEVSLINSFFIISEVKSTTVLPI